jgi:hypothetical protein
MFPKVFRKGYDMLKLKLSIETPWQENLQLQYVVVLAA